MTKILSLSTIVLTIASSLFSEIGRNSLDLSIGFVDDKLKGTSSTGTKSQSRIEGFTWSIGGSINAYSDSKSAYGLDIGAGISNGPDLSFTLGATEGSFEFINYGIGLLPYYNFTNDTKLFASFNYAYYDYELDYLGLKAKADGNSYSLGLGIEKKLSAITITPGIFFGINPDDAESNIDDPDGVTFSLPITLAQNENSEISLGVSYTKFDDFAINSTNYENTRIGFGLGYSHKF